MKPRMRETFDLPVTSMLAFCCADASVMETAATKGLRPKAPGVQVFTDFADARTACRGKLLVIDAYAAGGAEPSQLEHVQPGALLNLNPYRTPVPVTAAGGLMARASRAGTEVLLIYRRGVWDLPKGKLNDGESVAACGLREVREELGIAEVRIVRGLGRTVHGYADGSRYAVKTTYWYQMYTAAEDFDPEEEEDIEAAEWYEWSEARRRVGYETLRRHMDRVRHLVRVQP